MPAMLFVALIMLGHHVLGVEFGPLVLIAAFCTAGSIFTETP